MTVTTLGDFKLDKQSVCVNVCVCVCVCVMGYSAAKANYFKRGGAGVDL